MGPQQLSLGALDVRIRRNAYGRQIHSSIRKGLVDGRSFEMVFIRAPKIEGSGDGVEVLGTEGVQFEWLTTMSIPKLVRDFYDRIWNEGDLEAVSDLLTEDFLFRGSLGSERHGREDFTDYVQSVRGALSDYHCEILECVTEGEQAFAKMRFSGQHVAEFRGFNPTGLPVSWLGAALFRLEPSAIRELWVLGDLAGLDALLKKNQNQFQGLTEGASPAL